MRKNITTLATLIKDTRRQFWLLYNSQDARPSTTHHEAVLQMALEVVGRHQSRLAVHTGQLREHHPSHRIPLRRSEADLGQAGISLSLYAL